MGSERGARSGMRRAWRCASLGFGDGTANASSLSGSLLIGGTPIVGIHMPAAWTAASLSFDVNACPGGTWMPLKDGDGTEIAIQASASMAISASQLDHLGPWFGMRVRSGCGAASAVDQAASRVIVVVMKG